MATSVQDQWHYPILSKYGWTVIRGGSFKGFIGYTYSHPEMKFNISAGTDPNGVKFWTDKGISYGTPKSLIIQLKQWHRLT